MSDYYDYRVEERMRVTLAESSLLEQLVSITRMLEDVIRELNTTFSKALSGNVDEARNSYTKLRTLKDKVERIKDDALSYLARVSWYLPTSDLYRETFLLVNRCVQLADGAAHKMTLLLECETCHGKEKVIDASLKLIRILLDQANELANSTRLLVDNPRVSFDEGGKVIVLEERMDVEYRSTILKLYKEMSNDIITLMLAKDIIELIEDSADTLRDAAENIRFLAISRASRT